MATWRNDGAQGYVPNRPPEFAYGQLVAPIPTLVGRGNEYSYGRAHDNSLNTLYHADLEALRGLVEQGLTPRAVLLAAKDFGYEGMVAGPQQPELQGSGAAAAIARQKYTGLTDSKGNPIVSQIMLATGINPRTYAPQTMLIIRERASQRMDYTGVVYTQGQTEPLTFEIHQTPFRNRVLNRTNDSTILETFLGGSSPRINTDLLAFIERPFDAQPRNSFSHLSPVNIRPQGTQVKLINWRS